MFKLFAAGCLLSLFSSAFAHGASVGVVWPIENRDLALRNGSVVSFKKGGCIFHTAKDRTGVYSKWLVEDKCEISPALTLKRNDVVWTSDNFDGPQYIARLKSNNGYFDPPLKLRNELHAYDELAFSGNGNVLEGLVAGDFGCGLVGSEFVEFIPGTRMHPNKIILAKDLIIDGKKLAEKDEALSFRKDEKSGNYYFSREVQTHVFRPTGRDGVIRTARYRKAFAWQCPEAGLTFASEHPQAEIDADIPAKPVGRKFQCDNGFVLYLDTAAHLVRYELGGFVLERYYQEDERSDSNAFKLVT